MCLLQFINSSNSSFTECVTNHHLLIYSPLSFLNEEYTGYFSTQKSQTTSATFIFCIFNAQGTLGGAIYFTGSSSSLTISDSFFDNCNSTAGWGGAVYCYTCGKVIISSSSFTGCSCSSPLSSNINTAGGAIGLDTSSQLPEISNTSFISCSAGTDGGAVCLDRTKGGTNGANLPVKECRFLSCVAKGRSSTSAQNEADGGGLLFWDNANTIGISNSLFTNCESKQRAGGFILAIYSVFFDGIARFCFFKDNSALKGRNALIHFNTEGTKSWNGVFFHSFTADRSTSD